MGSEDGGLFRVLVTGSRHWKDWASILAAMRDARDARPEGLPVSRVVLVHGAAAGADSMCAQLAQVWGMRVEPHPADWDLCSPDCRPGHRRRWNPSYSYCPTAGLRRNAEMVGLGADLCLAFPLPGSTGTPHCVGLARAAGIPVRVYPKETAA